MAEFSGLLCVDEVYQDRLALLLAVDPAAPDGDRLVGYQLVHGLSVGQEDVRRFLTHLQEAGVAPEQVTTDGSPLYPGVLATVWPQGAHQWCLFHETRLVARAVRQAVKAVRASLPPLPAALTRRAPEASLWGTRGAAPLGAETVCNADEPAQTPVRPVRRGRGRCVRAVRLAGMATVHALRAKGHSIQGIARATGISRPTVRAWLRQPSLPTSSRNNRPADQPSVHPEEALSRWPLKR